MDMRIFKRLAFLCVGVYALNGASSWQADGLYGNGGRLLFRANGENVSGKRGPALTSELKDLGVPQDAINILVGGHITDRQALIQRNLSAAPRGGTAPQPAPQPAPARKAASHQPQAAAGEEDEEEFQRVLRESEISAARDEARRRQEEEERRQLAAALAASQAEAEKEGRARQRAAKQEREKRERAEREAQEKQRARRQAKENAELAQPLQQEYNDASAAQALKGRRSHSPKPQVAAAAAAAGEDDDLQRAIRASLNDENPRDAIYDKNILFRVNNTSGAQFRIKPIVGDGTCGFSSMYAGATGQAYSQGDLQEGQDPAGAVRQAVYDRIQQQSRHNKRIDDYINRRGVVHAHPYSKDEILNSPNYMIVTPGVGRDGLENQILSTADLIAEAYNRNLEVYQFKNNNPETQQLQLIRRYLASSPEAAQHDPIRIVRWQGFGPEHFDLLVSEGDNQGRHSPVQHRRQASATAASAARAPSPKSGRRSPAARPASPGELSGADYDMTEINKDLEDLLHLVGNQTGTLSYDAAQGLVEVAKRVQKALYENKPSLLKDTSIVSEVLHATRGKFPSDERRELLIKIAKSLKEKIDVLQRLKR